jgi:ribonuclease D
LREQGRESWMQEECARQQQQYASEFSEDFSDYYQNFKAAWQLQPQQLAALKKLAEWREQRARLRDKPRNWIVRDNALLAMASGMLTSKSQLSGLEDVSDNFIRFEGDQVLALIQEAKALTEAEYPAPVPKPLTQSQKNRLKKAQLFVETKAAELGLPAAFLGRKRTLLALLYAVKGNSDAEPDSSARELPDELKGWRAPLILEPLLEILRA